MRGGCGALDSSDSDRSPSTKKGHPIPTLLLALGWPVVGQFLGTAAWGFVSALIPFANAEAYLLVTASAARESVGLQRLLVVAIALGQSAGKVTLFLGVRKGRRLVRTHRRRHAAERSPRPPSRARTELARLTATLLRLAGSKRWGLPVTFLAAVVGLPPLYAVTLVAGASRMRVGPFAAVVVVGRLIRFSLIAAGVTATGVSWADWFDR